VRVAEKGWSLPVFRLNRAFGIGRGAKAFLSLQGGLTRGVVPDPRHHEEQAERLKKIVTRQRNALQRKDRRIEEQAANLEVLREQKRRESNMTDKIKQQRLEIFRLNNELDAKNELVENAKDVPPDARVSDKLRIGMLPDFVIVGTQKGGTSLLYRLLIRHPLVEPAATKELHFFDNNFAEGPSWYERHFPQSKRIDDRMTISGEATPSYLFDPLVPERMAKTVPDARLIALLRNPIERAYSQYQMQLRRGYEARSFEEAIQQEMEGKRGADYLARGRYAEQLERFAYFAHRDHLLVMKTEDFFSRRWDIFGRVLEFLELPPLEPFDMPPSNKSTYPPMDPGTRNRLEAYFKPYNQKLYEHLGVDFGW
jgi:hypothetical protein